jgi:predicted histone-like DNA-binding protein
MAIKYTLVQRGNPQKPDEQKKWYAQSVSEGEVDRKELGEKITRRCTVHYADVLAVLEALNQTLIDSLSENKIVRFGDLGSFRISAGSEGAETKKQFSSSMIKTKKVVFHPGEDLKKMLNSLKFEKA